MAQSSTSLAEARALLLSPLGPVARAGSNRDAVRVSFEFFPPKTDEAEANLWKAIRRLEPLNPAFVSVTYGAGGSTRERTHRTVQRIIAETSLRPAAHLTCVEASRDEVDEVIEGYKAIGVDHIVALRGDPPNSGGTGGAGIGGVYQPRADGYANATELTAAINRIGGVRRSDAVLTRLPSGRVGAFGSGGFKTVVAKAVFAVGNRRPSARSATGAPH